jgi:ribosome-associated protein
MSSNDQLPISKNWRPTGEKSSDAGYLGRARSSGIIRWPAAQGLPQSIMVGMILEPNDLTDVVAIADGLAIPIAELRFRFSRSSGPGGQHVNRSETRVELLFDIARSPSLSEEQRARITHRLAGYIDGAGMMHVVSSTTRSQLENRADATARFQALLAAALRPHKRRRPTRPSAAARERRLAEKRERSGAKTMRRKVEREE